MGTNTVAPETIDALLPQTQCRQCGYAGCRPYAAALAKGEAAINRCPPGGDEVIVELAGLLGMAPLPLDPACGAIAAPAVARIIETQCIGCTLCLPACPVDAIVGARRLMHTVITADCTGCALCLPPCPVDCIVMEPSGAPRDREQQRRDAAVLRERHDAHLRRHGRSAAGAETDPEQHKRETVAKAVERARARLAARGGRDPA
jgi:electron transport complex protein RnfB